MSYISISYIHEWITLILSIHVHFHVSDISYYCYCYWSSLHDIDEDNEIL